MKWDLRVITAVGVFFSLGLMLILTPLVDKQIDEAALSGFFALLGAALAYVFTGNDKH